MDIEQSIARDYIGRIVAATGLSATQIAREVGLAPSTLTRIYPQPQVKHTLSARTIAKIDRRFPGHMPPGPSLPPLANGMPHAFETNGGARVNGVDERRPSFAGFAPFRNIPINVSALAEEPYPARTDQGVTPVEVLEYSFTETLGFINRPPALDSHTDVRAIYFAGSAMEPRLRTGEPAFIDVRRPPRKGDEVAVVLRMEDEEAAKAKMLIRTLVGQSVDEIGLEQYSPPLRFTVQRSEVAYMWRLIPWTELIGAY